MYYKVMSNGRVIDTLDRLVYVKYQEKNNRMVLCSEDEAQGFLSSDKSRIWHEPSLYKIPIPGYDTVALEVIDKFEYEQLKIFKCRSIEEVIDTFLLELIEGGVI